MKVLIFSLLVISAFSGQVCFENGWVLLFEVSDETLDLSLTLTPLTLKNFDYVAIGFKEPSDPAGMEGADISVVVLGQGATDTYAQGNFVPASDVSLGGEENNLNQNFNAYTLTFTWQKPLVSNDVEIGLDKEFVEGQEYVVVWAAGLVRENTLQYHRENRGGVVINLDDNSYGCDVLQNN